MGRRCKEIKVTLHSPESENGLRCFEKRICDFYAAQVEKKLNYCDFTKQQKLELLQLLMDNYNTKS